MSKTPKPLCRSIWNARFVYGSGGADKGEILFPNRPVFSLDGHVEGVTITCGTGAVWITQEGDSRDYVLFSGEVFTACREGRLIVQILEEGCATIRSSKKPGSSWREKGANLLRSVCCGISGTKGSLLTERKNTCR